MNLNETALCNALLCGGLPAPPTTVNVAPHSKGDTASALTIGLVNVQVHFLFPRARWT